MGSIFRRSAGVTFALALLAAPALGAPVPLPNAKYEQPTIVMQAQNGQRLLDSFRTFLKLNGATKEVIDKIDAQMKQLLGEKGFAGIDLAKPLGGYAYIRTKLETSSMVFVVPVTTDKDALEFLGRLHIDARAEAKPKGVYELAGGPFDGGMKGHLRFHDKHAYVSINGGAESLEDPEKLVPISRLVDDKETGVIAASLIGSRLPKELADQAYPAFEKLDGEIDRNAARGGGAPKSMPAFLKELLGWSRRGFDLMIADGETLSARVLFDSKTGELDTEMVLQPKAKSALAADLATFKPAKGRFHQLMTKDAVGGGWLCLPGPIPKSVRATAANFFEEAIPMIGKDGGLPVELGAIFDAFGGIAQKAISAGELDVGAALTGPNKDGHYTAVAALGLDDPTPLVKLVLAIGKDLPKEFAEAIKLNAYKIGDVAVHTLALDKLIPAEVLKVVGEKAALNVAVGNKGLFLAVGPNAKAELERAMALKPAEARRAFDTLVNPAKAKVLAEHTGADLGPFQAYTLPDRPYSFYMYDLIGGPNLKMRSSLTQIAVWIMIAFEGKR